MGRIREDIEGEYLQQHPRERELLLPFVSCFDVTWAKRRRAFGSDLSVFFLKPEHHLEDAFGFEREILAVYSAYPSLEARTAQAIEQFLNDDPAKGRVDTMTAFLISEAADPVGWARQYITANPEARLIAAFGAAQLRKSAGDSWHVRSVLADQLYQRDLFDYRLPLRNDAYFFGREDLVFDFYNAFKRSENRGLFGLRKTGKTSLLYKLERRIQSEDKGHVFYFDCKYPPLRSLRWDQLLGRLASEILKYLNVHSSATGGATSADLFMEAISMCPSDQPVAVIFDEIEYISPFSPLDEHWKGDFVPFWQTIWACQSRHRNLSIFVAGVNSTVVEKDLINGIQNPLFGIVSHHYLRGLKVEELRRLVRTLGRRMGMRFSPESVEYLHERYGGHPLLTRIACSLTHKYLVEAGTRGQVDITNEQLTRDEDLRDAELSFYCRHVVSELRQFYPDEYQLLEYLSTGQLADYLEFTAEPEFTAHLSNYGLLDRDSSNRPSISIPVVARFIGMEVARRDGRKSILKVVEPGKRSGWLRQRVESIDSNLELLQATILRQGLPPLFGPVSYPESHRFFKLDVCQTENDFSTFINTCNRCFVESVEAYGQSIRNPDYFWKVIPSAYPALAEPLRRIKVYRHHRVHIRLGSNANDELMRFLNSDLEGRNPAVVDGLWFVLQQCVLDGILVGVLTELDHLA